MAGKCGSDKADPSTNTNNNNKIIILILNYYNFS